MFKGCSGSCEVAKVFEHNPQIAQNRSNSLMMRAIGGFLNAQSPLITCLRMDPLPQIRKNPRQVVQVTRNYRVRRPIDGGIYGQRLLKFLPCALEVSKLLLDATCSTASGCHKRMFGSKHVKGNCQRLFIGGEGSLKLTFVLQTIPLLEL